MIEAKHVLTTIHKDTVRCMTESVIVLAITDDRVFYVKKNLRSTTMSSDLHRNFVFNTIA